MTDQPLIGSRAEHGHAGDDAMRRTGQLGQDEPGVVDVGGLAVDAAAIRDHRVGGEDDGVDRVVFVGHATGLVVAQGLGALCRGNVRTSLLGFVKTGRDHLEPIAAVRQQPGPPGRG